MKKTRLCVGDGGDREQKRDRQRREQSKGERKKRERVCGSEKDTCTRDTCVYIERRGAEKDTCKRERERETGKEGKIERNSARK